MSRVMLSEATPEAPFGPCSDPADSRAPSPRSDSPRSVPGDDEEEERRGEAGGREDGGWARFGPDEDGLREGQPTPQTPGLERM